MPDHPLYLFKTARRPIYKKENLDLLAAERGSVMEFAWNRSWVAPEYFDEGSIARGTLAYFVFTDRPYESFVPVREGEVVSADWDDVMLRIKVLLRNPVGIEDDEMDLRTWTRLVKTTDPDLAPPHKFVTPKRDGVELVRFFDEREIPGWRRSVDHLLEMSEASEEHPYRTSVFFRPRGVQLEDGAELPSRRAILEPGARALLRLSFHNPHLEPGDVEHLTLSLQTPGGAIVAEGPSAVPLDDEVEIELRAGEDGEPEIRIEVAPAPAQHTGLLERFRRAGEEGRTEVEEAGETDTTELVALYHTVMRNTETPRLQDKLDVLNAFQRVLPQHQQIREEKAAVLLEQGKEDDAYTLLRTLNPELLGDASRFFLFRRLLMEDPEGDPYALVADHDLDSEGRFSRLLEEMEALPDATLNRLVPSLMGHLPDPEQLRRLGTGFGRRLTSPAALAETARNYYLNAEDPAIAFHFLNDIRQENGDNSPEIVDALVELAQAGGENRFDHELRQVVESRVTNLIGRSEFQEARAVLTRVSESLSGEERRRLYHDVADRLVRKERHDEAIGVMVEFAWNSCENGQLGHATEAVERARGLLAAAGDEQASWEEPVKDVARAVEDAWEDMEELVEWRRSDDERRRERLRERLLNRTVLIAGGLRRPEWEERLEDLTGAQLEWCEAFRDEADDLDAFADRIRNGRYALVVHFRQKTGHQTGDVLGPACDECEVPFVASRSAGRRGVEEAIWEAVGGEA